MFSPCEELNDDVDDGGLVIGDGKTRIGWEVAGEISSSTVHFGGLGVVY